MFKIKIDKKILAAVICAAVLPFAVTGCTKKPGGEDGGLEKEIDWDSTPEISIKGEKIVVLGYSDADVDSTAFQLFEAQGAKVEHYKVEAVVLADQLHHMQLMGEQVDLVQFKPDLFPAEYIADSFVSVDGEGLLDFSDDLWKGNAADLAADLEFRGTRYIAPLRITFPAYLQYSRALFKEEGLDDPYELYEKGKWTWERFIEMSVEFIENSTGGKRYGVTGWFAEPAFYSAGVPLVKEEDNLFKSNNGGGDVEKILDILEEIQEKNLYYSDRLWRGEYPESDQFLFYSMGDWTLQRSNEDNAEAQVYAVPFPKLDAGGEHYSIADFDAYLMVKGSEKQYAAARYIECERTVEVDPEFAKPAQDFAVKKLKLMNPAQYKAREKFLAEVKPVYDYGFGVKGLYRSGSSSDERGAYNNVYDTLMENGKRIAPGDISEAIDEQLRIYYSTVNTH